MINVGIIGSLFVGSALNTVRETVQNMRNIQTIQILYDSEVPVHVTPKTF